MVLMVSSYCPNTLYVAGNAFVSLVEPFVHKTFSIQVAKASISSLTRFNGEKEGKNRENIVTYSISLLTTLAWWWKRVFHKESTHIPSAGLWATLARFVCSVVN